MSSWSIGTARRPYGIGSKRNAYIRRVAAGSAAVNAPPWAAAIIARYAPVAVVLNDFYWSLFGQSRKTPYPTAEIERVCAETRFWPIAARIG